MHYTEKNIFVQYKWCRWSGSNRHEQAHTILSRARLPVPPQRQALGGV